MCVSVKNDSIDVVGDVVALFDRLYSDNNGLDCNLLGF